jgi:hypothetical protein
MKVMVILMPEKSTYGGRNRDFLNQNCYEIFLNELNMGFSTCMFRLEKSILALSSNPIKRISEFRYSQSISIINVPIEPYSLL